jgi:hypothetical protein
MKKKLDLRMQDNVPGIRIEQAKVKNPNQSMPVTAKAKMAIRGTQLKNK